MSYGQSVISEWAKIWPIKVLNAHSIDRKEHL